MANVVKIAASGPFILALMSDNSVWQANPAVVQPLAWTQLAPWIGTGTLTDITVIRLYATPVITDQGAYVPCVLGQDGTYWAYDETAGSWSNIGSGPP